jgi:hypothetical protein
VKLRALVLAAGVLVGLLWLVYGSLHPCTMLRHDLRRRLTAAATASDVIERWRRALGTAILDPALDLALRDRGPAGCLRGLFRLHTGTSPEDLLLGQ